jgi:hypothetical protein
MVSNTNLGNTSNQTTESNGFILCKVHMHLNATSESQVVKTVHENSTQSSTVRIFRCNENWIIVTKVNTYFCYMRRAQVQNKLARCKCQHFKTLIMKQLLTFEINDFKLNNKNKLSLLTTLVSSYTTASFCVRCIREGKSKLTIELLTSSGNKKSAI